MHIFALMIVGLVALIHAYILVLEMFLWTKPKGLKTFRNTPEKAEATKVLAANQGLYNGFLSAGLLWGLFHPNAALGWQIQFFFLVCVVVAGVFGAATVNKRIFWIQGFPAVLGLITLVLLR